MSSLLWLGLPVAATVVFALAVRTGSSAAPVAQLLGFGGSPESQAMVIAEHRAHHAFHIAGQVKGLYPGVHLRLRVTVTNPNRTAITVRTVRTTVGTAAKGCPGSNVRVSRFSGQLHVPGHGRRSLRVRVRMLRSAPNNCQGKRFPFQYRGTATP